MDFLLSSDNLIVRRRLVSQLLHHVVHVVHEIRWEPEGVEHTVQVARVA